METLQADDGFDVSEVRFAAAPRELVEEGLRGWVSCVLNRRLRLSELAVRQTLGGRLTLSFPAKLTDGGRQHFYFRPIHDDARLELERRIFEAIGLHQGPD